MQLLCRFSLLIQEYEDSASAGCVSGYTEMYPCRRLAYVSEVSKKRKAPGVGGVIVEPISGVREDRGTYGFVSPSYPLLFSERGDLTTRVEFVCDDPSATRPCCGKASRSLREAYPDRVLMQSTHADAIELVILIYASLAFGLIPPSPPPPLHTHTHHPLCACLLCITRRLRLSAWVPSPRERHSAWPYSRTFTVSVNRNWSCRLSRSLNQAPVGMLGITVEVRCSICATTIFPFFLLQLLLLRRNSNPYETCLPIAGMPLLSGIFDRSVSCANWIGADDTWAIASVRFFQSFADLVRIFSQDGYYPECTSI